MHNISNNNGKETAPRLAHNLHDFKKSQALYNDNSLRCQCPGLHGP